MIFSTDLIEDPNKQLEVELESEDDSNTFLESTLEYITERRIKQKKNDIKKKKFNIDINDIAHNPNKYLVKLMNDWAHKLNYDSLYLPFVDKMKEINQTCYDKIVKEVKADKESGVYIKLKENEDQVKYCDTAVLRQDYIESYSNIREDRNSASIKTDMIKIFTFINEMMKKVSAVNSPNDLEALNKMVKKHLDDTPETYDQIRGRLANQYSVPDEKFAAALYKYFRSGQAEPTTAYIPPEGKGNIDSNLVSKAYSEYMDIQGDLKYTIEIYSKKIYRDLEHSIKITTGNETHVNESFFNVETIKRVSKVFTEPQKILDLYILFYSAKMDALYERFKRNRAIMKAALEAINEMPEKKNKFLMNKAKDEEDD